MAVKTTYVCSVNKNTELELLKYNQFYIHISITNDYPISFFLDRETAIRLVKNLKREIANIESEVNNG